MIDDIRNSGHISPFFESLGQYVYGYKNENGTWAYIGKGNRNRALSHVKSKQLDPDDLYIIARNLEQFNNKTDAESFLLESFLITTNKPELNSVSGHYQECFIMAKFSELFTEYKNSQFDNFASLPTWYIDNYDKLKGRLNVVTIKSDNIYIETATREKFQLSFYVGKDDIPYQVRFAIWNVKKEDDLQQKLNELNAFLESCDIDLNTVEPFGSRNQFTITSIDSIEQVIDLLDNFMS